MRTQPWHGTARGHHVPAPRSHFVRAVNGASSTRTSDLWTSVGLEEKDLQDQDQDQAQPV